MGFDYYRNAGSGWGTNQFQFGPPPVPDFHPQPGWGGLDYFRAHALSPDPSLYNHAFSRVREYAGSGRGFGIGVGMHEAKQWHRKAYGGLGLMSQMLPEEIGHAAAYEAYRIWVHNSSMYEPFMDDMERQTEGLIGFAVAEATKLMQYSGRSWDSYGRMTACEAAAATASCIASQSGGMGMGMGMDMDMGDPYRMGRSRSRHNSISGYGPSYSDSSMYSDYGGGIDPYAYDNGYTFGYGRHGRSRSRHGSSRHGSRHGSRHRSHSMSEPMMMGDPGYAGSMGGFGSGYTGSGYAGSGYAGSGYAGSGYGGSGYGNSLSVAGSTYGGGLPGSYPISASYPVGGSMYGGSTYGGYGGIPVSGGSQVIVSTKPRHSSRRRSSSRHSRHHRSRSRSRGPVIIDASGYGGYPGSYY